MITLDAHLMSLVNRELVAPEEALQKAQDTNLMRENFIKMGLKFHEI
jgi:twitching motility protein PilT